MRGGGGGGGGESGGVVTSTALIKRDRKFTSLKVPRLCPLVLLVKVVWRQGRFLECKIGKVTGSGISVYGAAK
jgi:hypothetical protein